MEFEDRVAANSKKTGIYILLTELLEEQEISIGRLGCITFPRGFYAYVGSAMNGLKSRTNYHLRKKSHYRWHIDYLLERASIREIIVSETTARAECTLAQTLARGLKPIHGFGCSDCKCSSHLYFGQEKNRLRGKIIEAFNQGGFAHQSWSISHPISLCNEAQNPAKPKEV